ncbi:probable calcium-binding protein CML35 [Actinidia eriantha]|uniref:probable calcium-binding protein CML35 n=1 Tax=Actinidia eriantha TaxID=165200 RepID=UPI0025844A9B|nr:probable calcium-binding protein CML35 [Actinidia eriantha]
MASPSLSPFNIPSSPLYVSKQSSLSLSPRLHLPLLCLCFLVQTMKLINRINPKQFFRSKKSRSVSRSEPSSSSSSLSDFSDSSSTHNRKSETGKGTPGTPTSVLPGNSPEISVGEYSELVMAFNMIDRDGDGKITMKELAAVLSRVGAAPPSEEEILGMLGEVDRDGDGCISLEEFGAIGAAFAPPSCDQELREAFDFFDADHDGRITAEELKAVFSAIGDERCTLEECKRMIGGVGTNGDGFVCFEDFARMMVQHR